MIDEEAEAAGEILKDVVAAVRAWKSSKKIPLNAEIPTLEFVGTEAALLKDAIADISETTKASDITVAESAEFTEEVVSVKPVHAKLGPAFKAAAKGIVAAISEMNPSDVAEQLKSGKVIVKADEVYELDPEFFELETRLTLDGKAVETLQVGNVLIVLGI
jgi:valyl-tRNA synthetase